MVMTERRKDQIFQAGGALGYPSASYISRQADTNALAWARGREVLHVIAPRQTGKTSLLNRLRWELSRESWQCVYVDLAVFLERSGQDWPAQLGKMLGRALTPEQLPEFTYPSDLYNYLTTQVMSTGKKVKPRVAIFFDEIEAVHQALDPEPATAFFSTIRSLYNQKDFLNGDLTIALAGVVDPKTLIKNALLSPFNVGRRVQLTDFELEHVKALVGLFGETAVQVEPDVAEAIWKWTHGHPYLTQRICLQIESIARQQSHPISISSTDIDTLVDELFLSAPTSHTDSNIDHINEKMSSLSEGALAICRKLVRQGQISRDAVEEESRFVLLYLAGVVREDGENIRIRNEIYHRMLTQLSAPESAASEGRRHWWRVGIVALLTAIASAALILMMLFGWSKHNATLNCSGDDFRLMLTYPKYLATGDSGQVDLTVHNATTRTITVTVSLRMSSGAIPISSTQTVLTLLNPDEARSASIGFRRQSNSHWFWQPDWPIMITPTLKVQKMSHTCKASNPLPPVQSGPIHGLKATWLWLTGGGVISWLLLIPTEFLKSLAKKLAEKRAETSQES
jgi:hypothetical protein